MISHKKNNTRADHFVNVGKIQILNLLYMLVLSNAINT